MKIKSLLSLGVVTSAVFSALSVFIVVKVFGNAESGQPILLSAVSFIAVLLSGLCFVLLAARKLKEKTDGIVTYLEGVAEGDFNSNRPQVGGDEFGFLNEVICLSIDKVKKRIGFAEGVLNAIAMAYPFMTCDGKGEVDFVGSKLFEISGKTGRPEDYYGMTIGEYFYGERERKTRTDRVVSEGIRVEGETQFEGQGMTHFLQFSAEPIYDVDKEMSGALTIYFDLTEVKKQQQDIEDNARRVEKIAIDLVDITDQVNSSAGVIASQITEAAKGAEFQSERTTETATAMEEMNSTTMEVARNAISAADNAVDAKENADAGQDEVHSLIKSIETMRNQAETLGGFMNDLGQQTDSVGSVINVIQDIADQTNLLALNAAIEAARAGEAGRGFAVVADEVRKLAEKTMTATDEVGSAIKAIQEGAQRSIEGVKQANIAVEESTEIAQSSGNTLEKIVDIVNGTSDQVQSIATAAEQQSATSEQIHRAVDDINSIASQTAEGMREADAASEELVRMCGELNTLIRSLSD